MKSNAHQNFDAIEEQIADATKRADLHELRRLKARLGGAEPRLIRLVDEAITEATSRIETSAEGLGCA